jgi:hypothetical protein
MWDALGHDLVLEAVSEREDIWLPINLESWTANKLLIYQGMGSGFTRDQLNQLSIEMPDFVEAVRCALERASVEYGIRRRRALHTSAETTEEERKYYFGKSKEVNRKLRKLKRFREGWARQTFMLEEGCCCLCSCGSSDGSDERSAASTSS